MVRNTRLALACGLLTAATVALLGSRAPVTRPDAASVLPMPFAAGYALMRSEGWVASADDPAPMPATAAPTADSRMADPSLEGHRRPRGPREGRDSMERDGR